MAESQQIIDQYDFINAPQFVDFDDLAAQDDPDRDKFFETHREEDDFLMPLDIDSISPTVQLLDEENVRYSNEANKAAMAAGLADVKIEYYSSPLSQSQPSSANQKSINSLYGTPLGGSASECSNATSFYTPTGGEDKENVTPTPKASVVKKNANSSFITPEEKNQRNILAERSVEAKRELSSTNTNHNRSANSSASLISQLNKLVIVSSSDEEDDIELQSAQETYLNEESTQSQTSIHQTDFSTFNATKLAFLGLQEEVSGAAVESNEDLPEAGDVDPDMTMIVQQPVALQDEMHENSKSDSDLDDDENPCMELGTPVRNILMKLDAELKLEDQLSEDPRYSIVVAPSVGQQVMWNGDDHENFQHVAAGEEQSAKELNISYDVDETNAFVFEQRSTGEKFETLYFDTSSASTVVLNRRTSSVGDLVRAVELEPKARKFETYGYNPRAGITIPKTPDVNNETFEMNSQAAAFKNRNDKNGCYFEIEAPKPLPKSVRRASSCSDLVKLQKKKGATVNMKSTRTGLTIPRTPDTAKRPQRFVKKEPMSNASSVASISSRHGIPMRNTIKTVPNIAERLAAAQSRKPIKANHYVSMAEAMINYQKNTPDRFRSLPRGRVPEKRSASCDARKRHLASPSPSRSPESGPYSRSRADSISMCERRDIKPTRATGGPVLPKKIELKPTIPKPFHFGSTHRPKGAVVEKEEEVVDFKFKARPAPKILHEVSANMKHRPQVKVTQPMSPHFASDDRLRERHQKKQHVTKSPEAKLTNRSIMQRSSRIPTTRVQSDELKTTVVQPFSTSFEARQKEILRKKEVKIKQELEEARKGREFHANPVPKFSCKLPKKKPLEPTHVEPFQLKSDERGAAYQEEFKRKVEEEEQHLKEQAVFHAQPANVIHKPPFEPELPTRIIEPSEFQLATEKRAVEREQFDEQIREREREEEERKREELEKLEELQRLEDIERRRQLVHKAQPFKQPKPFQLKSSSRPLTIPQSPAFSALPSDRRIKAKSPHP